MRTLIALILAVMAAIGAFVVGMFLTAQAMLYFHGREAFNGDSGAKFALFLQGSAVGLVLGILAFCGVLFLSGQKRPTEEDVAR